MQLQTLQKYYEISQKYDAIKRQQQAAGKGIGPPDEALIEHLMSGGGISFGSHMQKSTQLSKLDCPCKT